ncbi:hypothetical protein ACFVYP_22465 [Kitasatospora sp. NPDC058201]|uniref:hypothetical protein n=1 Tax=unclassified Kitasatospora TaxID=2633591 RepID=UPI0036521063
MITSSDPAWSRWVGRTVDLPDGGPGIVRMARREVAADVLWAVDARGTVHRITRHHTPPGPCVHAAHPPAARPPAHAPPAAPGVECA